MTRAAEMSRTERLLFLLKDKVSVLHLILYILKPKYVTSVPLISLNLFFY